MSDIKLISDLQSNSNMSEDIPIISSAVFLLMNDLEQGQKSGAEKGWLSADDVKVYCKAKMREPSVPTPTLTNS